MIECSWPTTLEVMYCLLSKNKGIIRINIRVNNLSCHDVHQCTIWISFDIEGVNTSIQGVTKAQPILLVGLDTAFSLFLMVSMESILCSIAHSSNILKYFSTKGKAQSPLHHLLVVCSYSNSSSWSVSNPHVRCFYKHMSVQVAL